MVNKFRKPASNCHTGDLLLRHKVTNDVLYHHFGPQLVNCYENEKKMLLPYFLSCFNENYNREYKHLRELKQSQGKSARAQRVCSSNPKGRKSDGQR